jgi:pimeloyl-ACP methyl ester carboxylesterase
MSGAIEAPRGTAASSPPVGGNRSAERPVNAVLTRPGPTLVRSARTMPYLSVGEGPVLLLLQGFAMQPSTYLPLANQLRDRVRVIIPAIFNRREHWDFERTLDSLTELLDELGLSRVSLLGHSFGSGLELGLVGRCPDRIVECVFADTLGCRDRFSLAHEAVRKPLGFLRLATRPAVTSFVRSFATHPYRMVGAAWWGFTSHRGPGIDEVVRVGIPCHVMWAESDTLLARVDGEQFARRLHAMFTVARRPPGYGPIDHDWMFDDPELFAWHLAQLGLRVLSPHGAPRASEFRSPRDA